MENKTAVEWLESKLYEHEFDDPIYRATQCGWFEKAKEMEKNQMPITDEQFKNIFNQIKDVQHLSMYNTISKDYKEGYLHGIEWLYTKLKNNTP